MRLHRIRKSTIAEFLIIGSCIFLSGHSYSLVAGWQYDVGALFLAFIGCALLNPKVKVRKKIDDAQWMFIISISLGTILAYLTNWSQNIWIDAVIFIARIIIAYMIVVRIDIDHFGKLYTDWMTFLTIVSLVVYVLLQLNVTVPAYEYLGLNGLRYHTIWLCSWTSSINNIRGPFWEGGLYASLAMYAILYEYVFAKRRPRKFPFIVLMIGILVSQSTAGYLLLFLCIYIILTKAKEHHAIYDIITIVLFVLGMVYGEKIIVLLNKWNGDVFWKLAEQSMTTDTRLYSPLACLRVFLDNPLTGHGLSYATTMYNLYKPVFHIDALTSTSTFMLAAFGVLGVSYTVFIVRGIFTKRQFSVFTRLLLLILMLSITNKEPHTAIIFTYIFLFYLNQPDCGKNEENEDHIENY